jgi:tRNA (mo5U34)-methyltransferase
MAESPPPPAAGPPPAPPGFSAETFFAGRNWHQRWEVFAGVFTPGRNPVADLCARVRLPADLSGQSVLDVGAWHGAFSFECERRGAARVVAYSLENPDASGFNKLKALLHSRVEYVQGSAYTLAPELVGTFDVVLFFGVLYHLRYPLLAVDRLRTVCTGEAFIETHVVTDKHLLRGPRAGLARWLRLSGWFRDTPIWRQYAAGEINKSDQSNWFGPNPRAVIEAFESAGFAIEQVDAWEDRAAFRARVREAVPERLARHSYEGKFPGHSSLAGVPARDLRLFKTGDPPPGPAR